MAYEESTYTALSTSIEADADNNLSDIFNRALARESAVWSAFSYNGPFSSDHEDNRTILFGLYANAYLHGHNYLTEITDEDLQRLVDVYDNNIAKISNEEAQLVLEVAAKEYADTVKGLIHDEQMTTQRAKIAAKDDEYDAGFDKYGIDHDVTYDSFQKSMIEDYAVLVTKRDDLLLAQQKAEQRITELETLIEIEEVNYQLVGVDITREELRLARAELDLVNAQTKALDIQLQITSTILQQTNTDLQITEATNELTEKELQTTEVGLQESNVDLQIVRSGLNLTKAQAEGERTQVRTQEVGIRVAETELEEEEIELKEAQYEVDIARIKAETTERGFADNELTILQTQKRIEEAEYDLMAKEKQMIIARQDNVEDETEYVEDQQASQEALDEKQVEYDSALHAYEVGVIQNEAALETNIADKKIDLLDNIRRELLDQKVDREIQDEFDKAEVYDIRADKAEDYTEAAIDAAEQLANADIVNRLTHSVSNA